LNATAAGNHTGNITHVSTGASTINLVVSGTAVLPPSVTITQSITEFVQVIGTSSKAQSYAISGANLTGSVTITPPLRYELSLNGRNWQSAPVTLSPINGTLASTTINVRLNGIVTGSYNGNLVHSTTGLADINVPVSGMVTIKSDYGVYPVPAHHVVYFGHPQTFNGSITIYTIEGQVLKTVNIQPGVFETPVDVSGLANGLYMAEIKTDNKKIVLRFMKQ
jgi:hypothetical protein